MAKIDTSTIDGYAEMTVEQKLAALEAFEYEDGLSEIERLKGANSRANAEAAEWKRKHNALLSEEEQKKQASDDELAALRLKVEMMEKEKSLSEYKAKYLAMGYDEKLAADTAAALASGDMEKVFANGEKFRADLEKKIKAEVLRGTPRPASVDSSLPTVTKEQFDAMGYTDRAKLYQENQELYNELMNGGK